MEHGEVIEEKKVEKGTEKEEKKEEKKLVELTILPDMESIHFFGAIPKPALVAMYAENKTIYVQAVGQMYFQTLKQYIKVKF